MPARRAAQLSASRLVLGLLLLTLPAAAGAATLHRVGFLPGTADPRFSVVGGAQGNVYFHGLATPSPPSTAAFANVRWSQPTGLELFAGLVAPQPAPEITGGTPFGTTIDAQGQVVAEFDALGTATPVPWIARTYASSLADATPDARVFVGWYGSNASANAMFRYTVGGALELVGDPADEAIAQAVAVPNHGGFVVANDVVTGVVDAAFRWLPDGSRAYLPLPPTHPAPANTFSAFGVSQDGATIVGSVHPTGLTLGVAARWTEAGGTELLADPGGVFSASVARHVGPDGRIYGWGLLATSGVQTAMVWDAANGMRDLQALLVAEHGFAFGGDRMTLAVPSDDGDELTGILFRPSTLSQEGFVIFLDPSAPAVPWWGLAAAAFALLAIGAQWARFAPTSDEGSR